MNNNGNAIKIEKCQRFITRQIPVTVWEDRMLRRIRKLMERGDGEFIVRKCGDEVTICRIGKPEIVKG